MRWPFVAALVVIVSATLVASFVSMVDAASHQGAHWTAQVAIPLALEPLALLAAWQHLRHHKRYEACVLLGCLAVAVAINVADAARLPVDAKYLMALSVIPPVAAVVAGHIGLRELAFRRAARDVLRDELAPEVRDELRVELRDPLRDELRAELRAQLEPKVRAELRATLREVETTTTTTQTERVREHAVSWDDALAGLADDTRPVVESWVDGGGDVRDAELVDRVMAATGRGRRTAQQRLRPVRDAVSTNGHHAE